MSYIIGAVKIITLISLNINKHGNSQEEIYDQAVFVLWCRVQGNDIAFDMHNVS